jgi:hypothetical protein
LKTQQKNQDEILKNFHTVLIENLPQNYNHLMLKELIKNYPGVTDAKLDNKEQYALVKFDTPD